MFYAEFGMLAGGTGGGSYGSAFLDGMESAGNEWTNDNALYYTYKLYGRHI